jgi:hypothetical protein
MRNTLAFLAALVLVVAGLGWYLGWYHVLFTPGGSGHETVKIDIDTDKVNADLKKGEKKLLEETKGKLPGLKDTGKAPAPSSPLGALEEQEPPAPPRPFDPSGAVPFTPLKPGSVPPMATPFGGANERK